MPISELMPKSPHIFLFSVHKDAMDAAVRAFAADWPEARVSNLLDDSLFAWVREAGGVVSGVRRRGDHVRQNSPL